MHFRDEQKLKRDYDSYCRIAKEPDPLYYRIDSQGNLLYHYGEILLKGGESLNDFFARHQFFPSVKHNLPVLGLIDKMGDWHENRTDFFCRDYKDTLLWAQYLDSFVNSLRSQDILIMVDVHC